MTGYSAYCKTTGIGRVSIDVDSPSDAALVLAQRNERDGRHYQGAGPFEICVTTSRRPPYEVTARHKVELVRRGFQLEVGSVTLVNAW